MVFATTRLESEIEVEVPADNDSSQQCAVTSANAKQVSAAIQHEELPLPYAIKAYTLGQFQVFRRQLDGQYEVIPDAAWRHGRSKALFLLLLTRPTGNVSRETASELLWPRASLVTRKTNLNNAIWNIRQALQMPHEPDANPFTADRETLHLCKPSSLVTPIRIASTQCWSDLFAFDQAYRDMRLARTEDDFRRAVHTGYALFRGDLQGGISDEWFAAKRLRVRSQWSEMLFTYAKRQTGQGQTGGAIHTLSLLINEQPDHVEGTEFLIHLLMTSKRHTEAKVHQARLRKLYR